MTPLLLHGSPTSPYVRRARIVARELGVPLVFVDSRSPEAQEKLRALTPIAKVPILETPSGVIFDSHDIVEWLIEHHGPGPLRGEDDRRAERNFHHVIDGALDAAIRLFYAQRDGVPTSAPFLAREEQRLHQCLSWLEARVEGSSCGGAPGLGVIEVALLTVIDWLRFRAATDLGRYPRLAAFADAWAEHPACRETVPSESMPAA